MEVICPWRKVLSLTYEPCKRIYSVHFIFLVLFDPFVYFSTLALTRPEFYDRQKISDCYAH
jgi:hypothetical protein